MAQISICLQNCLPACRESSPLRQTCRLDLSNVYNVVSKGPILKAVAGPLCQLLCCKAYLHLCRSTRICTSLLASDLATAPAKTGRIVLGSAGVGKGGGRTFWELGEHLWAWEDGADGAQGWGGIGGGSTHHILHHKPCSQARQPYTGWSSCQLSCLPSDNTRLSVVLSRCGISCPRCSLRLGTLLQDYGSPWSDQRTYLIILRVVLRAKF